MFITKRDSCSVKYSQKICSVKSRANFYVFCERVSKICIMRPIGGVHHATACGGTKKRITLFAKRDASADADIMYLLRSALCIAVGDIVDKKAVLCYAYGGCRQ